MAVKKMMLDEEVKELARVKEDIAKLDKERKTLKESQEYWEGLILTKLQTEGLNSVRTIHGTVGKKTDTVPNITDWNKTFPWLVKHHPELIPKKVNSAGWRELCEEGVEVPGVEAVELHKLTFRKPTAKAKTTK